MKEKAEEITRVIFEFNKPLTQVAHYSGISKATLERLVKGKVKKPRKETVLKLITYLMGGDND